MLTSRETAVTEAGSVPSAQPALRRARDVLDALHIEPVEKTIWGSPAGKKRIAKRLAAMLPGHRSYVEPFAGSAAVLFAKPQCAVEAINDANPEIADAYRLIQRLTPQDLVKLQKMPWVGDEAEFKSRFDLKPKSDLERLHRFLYVTHFSYGKLRTRSFNPNAVGVEAKTLKRIEEFGPRLRRVHVYSGDYERVCRKYDSRDTVLFLDPPYPGYDVNVGERGFDEQRFFKLLNELKGKFLITYGIKGKLPRLVKDAGFFVKQIRTPRTISAMRGVGGPKVLTQLLIANYEPTSKRDDPSFQLVDFTPEPLDPSLAAFAKSLPLVKGVDPNDERYVLGIVLEPETVDAQGDIYSEAEIRSAAHRFMEEFGGLGLMHRMRVNEQVKVLESFLAPDDLRLGDTTVKKGTWLLAVRVLSDPLWEQVKSGELTGFSIGGSARRYPETSTRSAESEPGSAEPTQEAS